MVSPWRSTLGLNCLVWLMDYPGAALDGVEEAVTLKALSESPAVEKAVVDFQSLFTFSWFSSTMCRVSPSRGSGGGRWWSAGSVSWGSAVRGLLCLWYYRYVLFCRQSFHRFASRHHHFVHYKVSILRWEFMLLRTGSGVLNPGPGESQGVQAFVVNCNQLL